MATQNQAIWTNPTSDRLEAGGVGIVPSKLTTTQRNALTLTVNDVGLTCIDTTLGALMVWSGSAWISGGVSLVNAADTQILFDDGGAIAGNAAFTFTKATGAVNMTGPLLGVSGTLTASNPQIQLAQVWNNAGVTFNGILFNAADTASNTASTFLEFQLTGSAKFRVRKDGALLVADGAAATPTLSFINNTTLGFHHVAASTWTCYGSNNRDIAMGGSSTGGFYLRNDVGMGWSSTTDAYAGSPDVILNRDAAGVLALKNSTNSQTFRVYGTTVGPKYAVLSHDANNAFAYSFTGQLAFNTAALATTATTGFPCMVTCAGTPTGVPANIPTGQVPWVYDNTNNKICVYNGGWKQTVALL